MKKVIYSPEWRDGKPRRTATPEEAERSPRIVKYVRLESYEDALDGIAFDEEAAQLRLEDRIEGYLLRYMLKWETKASMTLLHASSLISPFEYRLQGRSNGVALDLAADVPETFNYLLGLKVRTRRVYERDGQRYVVYRGETRESPGREAVVIWRATEGWTLDEFRRDERFVAEQGITEGGGRDIRERGLVHKGHEAGGVAVQAADVRGGGPDCPFPLAGGRLGWGVTESITSRGTPPKKKHDRR